MPGTAPPVPAHGSVPGTVRHGLAAARRRSTARDDRDEGARGTSTGRGTTRPVSAHGSVPGTVSGRHGGPPPEHGQERPCRGSTWHQHRQGHDSAGVRPRVHPRHCPRTAWRPAAGARPRTTVSRHHVYRPPAGTRRRRHPPAVVPRTEPLMTAPRVRAPPPSDTARRPAAEARPGTTATRGHAAPAPGRDTAWRRPAAGARPGTAATRPHAVPAPGRGPAGARRRRYPHESGPGAAPPVPGSLTGPG